MVEYRNVVEFFVHELGLTEDAARQAAESCVTVADAMALVERLNDDNDAFLRLVAIDNTAPHGEAVNTASNVLEQVTGIDLPQSPAIAIGLGSQTTPEEIIDGGYAAYIHDLNNRPLTIDGQTISFAELFTRGLPITLNRPNPDDALHQMLQADKPSFPTVVTDLMANPDNADFNRVYWNGLLAELINDPTRANCQILLSDVNEPVTPTVPTTASPMART